MNFLGHLYFSNNDLQLMHANLFGDFVKGRDITYFPESIQKGITLHRAIDDYIDHHPAIIEVMHVLYEPLPKIAGIAIDLYVDHLLAKNWSNFHDKPLREFVDAFYQSPVENRSHYSISYLTLLEKMKTQDWLYNYQKLEGLRKASLGLSRRISFPNTLHTAPDVFVKYEKAIEESFELFMLDALPYFKTYLSNL